eukprot:360772-Chlamydomonas_euryale.AAC.9
MVAHARLRRSGVPGLAWHKPVWHGVAWRGMVSRGVVRYGLSYGTVCRVSSRQSWPQGKGEGRGRLSQHHTHPHLVLILRRHQRRGTGPPGSALRPPLHPHLVLILRRHQHVVQLLAQRYGPEERREPRLHAVVDEVGREVHDPSEVKHAAKRSAVQQIAAPCLVSNPQTVATAVVRGLLERVCRLVEHSVPEGRGEGPGYGLAGVRVLIGTEGDVEHSVPGGCREGGGMDSRACVLLWAGKGTLNTVSLGTAGAAGWGLAPGKGMQAMIPCASVLRRLAMWESGRGMQLTQVKGLD